MSEDQRFDPQSCHKLSFNSARCWLFVCKLFNKMKNKFTQPHLHQSNLLIVFVYLSINDRGGSWGSVVHFDLSIFCFSIFDFPPDPPSFWFQEPELCIVQFLQRKVWWVQMLFKKPICSVRMQRMKYNERNILLKAIDK